jgi:hypothetical protein
MIRAIQQVLLDKEDDVAMEMSKEEEEFINDEKKDDDTENEEEEEGDEEDVPSKSFDEITELTEDDLEVKKLILMDQDESLEDNEKTKCMKLLISIINYHQSGLVKSRNYKIQQILYGVL